MLISRIVWILAGSVAWRTSWISQFCSLIAWFLWISILHLLACWNIACKKCRDWYIAFPYDWRHSSLDDFFSIWFSPLSFLSMSLIHYWFCLWPLSWCQVGLWWPPTEDAEEGNLMLFSGLGCSSHLLGGRNQLELWSQPWRQSILETTQWNNLTKALCD